MQNWQNNAIQFPRLLAEIMATQELNMESLAESMDLTIEEVAELFDRADQQWEAAKNNKAEETQKSVPLDNHISWKASGEANEYFLMKDGNWLANFRMNGELLVGQQEQYAALFASGPKMFSVLNQTVKPLMRLGDFVGNIDKGGASGLGQIDRCSILCQVRSTISQAKPAFVES